ncbi:MAG: type II toxin-antitoxin system Phd/YefM family antitoxin [Candidatus Brocadiaceae bacterium]|nr:type II toxin-antitoxin system Phd/YefM family antitoxin [Candidatus Brocadiaceae bacterium]
MIEVTVNKFRAKLKESVERVISNHEPMRVSRRNGDDFIVISADDWLQEQETLYVLQNSSLMEQIAISSKTHKKGKGYKPNRKELDEINSI